MIYPCPFQSNIECKRKPGHTRCTGCGFNPYVKEYRKGLIAAGGLKTDSDGLRRLHLIKEEK